MGSVGLSVKYVAIPTLMVTATNTNTNWILKNYFTSTTTNSNQVRRYISDINVTQLVCLALFPGQTGGREAGAGAVVTLCSLL